MLADEPKVCISHVGSTAIKGICAKSYEQLKLDLWKKYEHNRDGYTAAKTEFVEKYTKEAIAARKKLAGKINSG